MNKVELEFRPGVVRRQFTRWDGEHNHEVYLNKEYLDFEKVESGLSSAICTMGYFDTVSGRWVKKADALIKELGKEKI